MVSEWYGLYVFTRNVFLGLDSLESKISASYY